MPNSHNFFLGLILKLTCQLYQEYCHLHDYIDQTLYIKIFSSIEENIHKDIKQERSKDGTLWHFCNYAFPFTKSDACSSAFKTEDSDEKTEENFGKKTEGSGSRLLASNFIIHSLWFRVSNALKRHMITMLILSSFFRCSPIFDPSQ